MVADLSWVVAGATEISPLFGLTLIELVELISIISIVGVFLTGFFLYISTIRKTKTESANISIKMIEMSQLDKYQIVFEKLREKKELKEQEIKDILRYYEYVAEFAKDNVITYNHILHIHGFNLKGLYNNKQVRKYFEDARKIRPNYTFINLYDLFLKIDDDFSALNPDGNYQVIIMPEQKKQILENQDKAEKWDKLQGKN